MNTDPVQTAASNDTSRMYSGAAWTGATSIGGDIVLTAVRPKGRRGTRGQIPTPPLGAVVPHMTAGPIATSFTY